MREPVLLHSKKDSNLQVEPLPVEPECCSLMLYLPWTIVYCIVIGDTDSKYCSSQVWFWATYAKYYFIVATIGHAMSTLWAVALYLKPPSSSSSITFLINFIFAVIITMIRISGIVVVTGIFISFFHRNECIPLRAIITFQFFIVLVIQLILLIAILSFVYVYLEDRGNQQTGQDQSNIHSSFQRNTVNAIGGALPIVRALKRSRQNASRETELV